MKASVAHRQASVSIILVEKNAKVALGLAQQGCMLEVRSVILEGNSKDRATDMHVRMPDLGGRKGTIG